MGASDGSDQPAVPTSPGDDDDSGFGQRSLIVVGTALFLVGLAVVLGVQVGGMFAPGEPTDTPSPTDVGGSNGGGGGPDGGDATDGGGGDGGDGGGTQGTDGSEATATSGSPTGTPWPTPTDGPPTVSPAPSETPSSTPTSTPESTPTETGGIIDW